MLVIFITISIIAILLTRGIKLSERITEFSKGAGHKNMLLMVWIFILAGAFASSAKSDAEIAVPDVAVEPHHSEVFLNVTLVKLVQP